MSAGDLEPADAGDTGMLADIIAEVPDDYDGDRLELVVNTLNHRVMAQRNPLAVELADELADREARREATRVRAEQASAEMIEIAGRADAALTAVLRLHGRRNADDGRCRTCRTTKGKPAPWPCETYLAVADAGFVARPSDELIEVLRAYGTWQNSRTERDRLRFHELSAAYQDRQEHTDEYHRH